MHRARVPLETALPQPNSIRSSSLTYPASARILSAAPRTAMSPAPPRVPLPSAAAHAQPRRRAGGGQGWGRAPRPPRHPGPGSPAAWGAAAALCSTE